MDLVTPFTEGALIAVDAGTRAFAANPWPWLGLTAVLSVLAVLPGRRRRS